MMFLKTGLLGVVLLLLGSSVAASSLLVEEEPDDDFDDEDFSSLRINRGLAIAKPLWFDRIKAEDTTGLLKACAKKQPDGPVNGQRCGRREKICMFGSQECANGESHPEISCYCDGAQGNRTWTCIQQVCANAKDDLTWCPPDGKGFQDGGDPRCPSTRPENLSTCTVSGFQPSDDSGSVLVCDFGNRKCCGLCDKEASCFCSFGLWLCVPEQPACDVTWGGGQNTCKSHNFQTIAGQTCEEATAAILGVYPTVTVVCENESADPKITDDDENRFAVYTNDGASGNVTQIVFNRRAECASASDRCEFAGQVCDFSTSGEFCTTTKACSCQGARSTMDCWGFTTCI